MKKTSNYQLNQWDPDDRVLRTDFNGDNAKIDAAIAAVAAAKADKTVLAALQTAFDTAKATIPKVAAGSYTGDGAASRTISLAFTPKAVLVVCGNGKVNDGHGDVYGGLAVSGGAVSEEYGSQITTAVQIVSGGFRVFYKIADYRSARTNSSGDSYRYLAIG